MDAWTLYELVEAEMGADELNAEIVRCMSDIELREAIEYVANCHDINTDEADE